MILILMTAVLLGVPSDALSGPGIEPHRAVIAYERSIRNGPSEIFVMSTDGRDRHRLAAGVVSIGRRTA
jgi:hypothetical protein